MRMKLYRGDGGGARKVESGLYGKTNCIHCVIPGACPVWVPGCPEPSLFGQNAGFCIIF